MRRCAVKSYSVTKHKHSICLKTNGYEQDPREKVPVKDLISKLEKQSPDSYVSKILPHRMNNSFYRGPPNGYF